MLIKTTAGQDVDMMDAVLDICEKSDKVSETFFVFRLRHASHILDGQLIPDDSESYADKVRWHHFCELCEAAEYVLLILKMLRRVTELSDNFGHPTEMVYLRVTKLGAAYKKLPRIMKLCVVMGATNGLWCVQTIKKYRWLATIVSVLTTVFKWISAHTLTTPAIYAAILLGIVSALGTGALGHWLNGPPVPAKPDDDLSA
jgi:hypothetical protein